MKFNDFVAQQEEMSEDARFETVRKLANDYRQLIATRNDSFLPDKDRYIARDELYEITHIALMFKPEEIALFCMELVSNADNHHVGSMSLTVFCNRLIETRRRHPELV